MQTPDLYSITSVSLGRINFMEKIVNHKICIT